MVQIACPCPAKDGEPRHESDEVTLRERLGFVEAAAIRNRIGLRRAEAGADLESDEILAVLTEGYILHGVESWTLVGPDEKGVDRPIPVTRANVRVYILDRWEIASVVADAADEAYSEAVMLPLLRAASTSSQPTPTEGSTSPSPATGTQDPRPLKPSSISTTPTDATETTSPSPAGASRSSRSSRSAA